MKSSTIRIVPDRSGHAITVRGVGGRKARFVCSTETLRALFTALANYDAIKPFFDEAVRRSVARILTMKGGAK